MHVHVCVIVYCVVLLAEQMVACVGLVVFQQCPVVQRRTKDP